MNPCPKNKPRIAWMAAGVLDATEAQALRQHLGTCPGCRGYWHAMSALSERLVNASDLPLAEPTESFHRRVGQNIQELEKAPPLFNWVIILHRLLVERRLTAISAAMVLGVVTLLWLPRFGGDQQRFPAPGPMTTIRETRPPPASPPTVASYRRAAEVSLESLDALLTKQVARNASAIENFSVSSLLARSSEN
jgi:anti-sigma factor RsiW